MKQVKKYIARKVALETLHKLEKSSSPLPVLFQKICTQAKITQADRGLAMNLIYGVLRQKQYLDEVIVHLCSLPIKKLDPRVHHGLAVGLYQILFLDRIPDSAAVNETVNSVKALKVPKRLHGFVNGVLRNAIRKKEEFPAPEKCVKNNRPVLNHPQWLTSRWQQKFGKEEMIRICRRNNLQPSLELRVNTEKIGRDDYLQLLQKEDIVCKPGRYSPTGLTLPDFQGAITSLPGYADGHFQVQGEAAQLASLLLGPFDKGGHILDGCAGVGGKTGHILQLTAGKNWSLTAVEPEINRREKLTSNLALLFPGAEYNLFPGNLEQFYEKSNRLFNAILLDAPCSGTGVISRQPDIRWRRKETDLLEYSAKQQQLLQVAAKMIAPDGVLVYATCSMEQEENIDIVDSFLQKHPNFELSDCSKLLPKNATTIVRDKCFQPRPSDLIDGFFGARLVRKR